MKSMPKRMKFRKSQRGTLKGNATRGNFVAFGEYGLMALENAYISARQIEACRVAAAHTMGKEGRLFIRIFPHKPMTSTPAETRMGKGKGEPEFYAAKVRAGKVMFEIAGLPEEFAKKTLNSLAHKLPIRVKMVYRRHGL